MKEDIENLAEFMYLAYKQVHWEADLIHHIMYEWSEAPPELRDSWKAAAKVALEFKQSN